MSAARRHERVVILDRDGTVVVDRGYARAASALEFMSGAAAGLRKLSESGYRLVIITNQSGVGRGFFTLDELIAMNRRLRYMVREAGAELAGVYFCPHVPEAGCACRKPALALMHQAASELGFAPESSIVIGDKVTDIEFGRRAGATTILLGSAQTPTEDDVTWDFRASNLHEAATWITARQSHD